MVSGVFFVGYILDKILKKNGGCLFNLWKNVRDVSFVFVYLSLISILLFNMLIVGIYLEINGIPMILCLISVIWNICLNGLVKILFCSIVLVGRRNN